MQRVKLLKIMMLLTLVVFVGVVITSYRTGRTISDSSADEELRNLVAGEKIIQKEFNQKRYEKEQLKSEISAREMVNYENGVNVLEDVHLSRGEDGMEVRSDFGRHDQESGDAFLWENVLIRDGQGMTIRTESALLHQEPSIVVGDKLVEFSDPRISGSSLGVIYNRDNGELQLPAQVDLTIHGGEGLVDQPVTVRAGYLKMIREPGIVYLARGVKLEQGRLSLNSRTLRIEFEETSRRIRHVSAFGDVVLEMSDDGEAGDQEANSGGLDALGDDPGRKTLHAGQLEIFFDRESPETARLDYLVARGTPEGKAILRSYPSSANSEGGGGFRQLEGFRLVFRFCPHGTGNRLDSFHAEGGCLMRLVDDGPDEIRLSGETLTASFDPLLQELEAAEVSGGVHFSRGREQIRGHHANFDADQGLLFITGEENGRLPRLWNDTVELEAVRLTYSVDGQLLEAEEDVWVKVQGEEEEMGLDVALFSRGGAEEPVYIHADRLESDLEAGVSTFQGTVRVLNGENVLSTRNLWLYHEDRRMEALERVLLVIHPLAGSTDRVEEAGEGGSGIPAVEELARTLSPGEASFPDSALPGDEDAAPEAFDRSAPLQITCRELIYDDQARFIMLNDNVSVRKHRTRLAADHMEVQLDQEDNRVLHIIASAGGSEAAPGIADGLSGKDHLVTGFDSQASRQRGTTTAQSTTTDGSPGTAEAGAAVDIASGMPVAGGGTDAGQGASPSRRPRVPQVTLSQPGGRTATGERVLYYPDEQLAVLVGLDTVATVVDPRSGSAQGTSLTYHLADGKILNRANENEVTLVLLHAGASTAGKAGRGSGVPTRGTGSNTTNSSSKAGASPAGRSITR